MSSPNTPLHSRQSTMDYASPQAGFEPSTPLHEAHHSFSNSESMDVFNTSGMGGGGGGGDGGLGNLADELADALSEDEDDDEMDDMDGTAYFEDENGPRSEGGAVPPDINLSEAGGGEGGGSGQRDSGVDVASAPSPNGTASTAAARGGSGSLSLPSGNGGRGRHHNHHHHHKRTDSVYDGSEYGSDSDLESPGMPPSLVAKIDAVESLARRGTEDNGGPTDGVCKRLTEELRDLGSQATVEGGASRLITAHSALTTHLTHQTRQLQGLAFPLFSPLTAPLVAPALLAGGRDEGDDEGSDDEDTSLLPMLTALAQQVPRPSTAAYQSLTALHSLTSDLVSTLNYLSDTLHMARQTTTTATRRLRSAKELVAEMRRDEELREQGELWLARGNWNERLQRRECAHVCGDVVGGFEEVCNGWRARLLASAEARASG